MKALLYTKDNCPYCTRAKHLLGLKGVEFSEIKIGTDMVREDFISLFPDQKTVPLIFIDEQRVGGFDDLEQYFANQNQLLNG